MSMYELPVFHTPHLPIPFSRVDPHTCSRVDTSNRMFYVKHSSHYELLRTVQPTVQPARFRPPTLPQTPGKHTSFAHTPKEMTVIHSPLAFLYYHESSGISRSLSVFFGAALRAGFAFRGAVTSSLISIMNLILRRKVFSHFGRRSGSRAATEGHCL